MDLIHRRRGPVGVEFRYTEVRYDVDSEIDVHVRMSMAIMPVLSVEQSTRTYSRSQLRQTSRTSSYL